MKTPIAILLLACFDCLILRAELPPAWSTNYSATVADAATAQAPTLAFFTASWCGPCKLMTRITLADPSIGQALSRFKCVAVDIDENHDLASRFNIEAVPTFIMLSPNSNEVQRATGFQAPEEFLPWLTNGVLAVREAVAKEALLRQKLAAVDRVLNSTNTGSELQAAAQLFELCSARDDAIVHAAAARLQQLAVRAPLVLLNGLNDPQLATRIQIANALRARLGEGFDLDPWSDAATRAKSADRWRLRLSPSR